MFGPFFVIVCLCIGIALQNKKGIPQELPKYLGVLLTYIFIPSVILFHFDEIKITPTIGKIILAPWLLYICSILFFNLVDYFYPLNKQHKGVLILTSGISSVSFVGFPLFEALYGREGLTVGIIMSQAGTVLCSSTLGVATATYYTSQNPKISTILKQVFTFPPTIAFIIALVANVSHYPLPRICIYSFEQLSQAFQPIALLTVGLQIRFYLTKTDCTQLAWGFLFKLFISPLLIFILFRCILHQNDMIANISILSAAIGSMNTTAIIANRYNLMPELANKMVGFTIPISLFIIYTLYFLVF